MRDGSAGCCGTHDGVAPGVRAAGLDEIKYLHS